MTDFSPREIVSELDRYIIGQRDAKRAVAIALRNRWRRQQLDEKLREEVLPKNILMIGPTGVGKTEISRRLAKLAGAPFIKVEATKFTEVGYVGRDVEQIVRDLVEVGIAQTRETQAQGRARPSAQLAAEERVVDALVGENASAATKDASASGCAPASSTTRRSRSRCRPRGGGMPLFEIPGMPGAQMGAISIGDMFGKLGGGRTKTRRVTVAESHDLLINEESDKLLDNDQLVQEAINAVEKNGIVFLDEIDKIAGREGRIGADVSREGVQRDLLPLIEGTTVVDQARRGEDRPYPVHRVGRVPHLQAVGPAARAAGPAADPGRAAPAHARRFPPHPDRARGVADQAIRCADGDRGRDARIHRRRDRRHRRHRGRRSIRASRISARGGCRR